MTSEFEETQKLLNILKESNLSILYPVVVISVSELMQIFLFKHVLSFWNSTFYLTKLYQAEEIHPNPKEKTLCARLSLLSCSDLYWLPALTWLKTGLENNAIQPSNQFHFIFFIKIWTCVAESISLDNVEELYLEYYQDAIREEFLKLKKKMREKIRWKKIYL